MSIEIATKKMVWQLTLFSLLISSFAIHAQSQSARSTAPESGSKPIGVAVYSIHWQHLPVAAAASRLEELTGAIVMLDRRVDPTQRVDLELEDLSTVEIIAQLAANCALGDTRFERLYYIGPRPVADRLAALATLRRREVASMLAPLRKTLMARRQIGWPALTEPRQLIVHMLQEHGWQTAADDRIPHDLWPSGELPSMALADQLTLLLVGFDLTYHIQPTRQTIEIVPLDWEAIKPKQPPRAEITKRARSPIEGRQRFTLRIENQPVRSVLNQLGERLVWQVTVDEAAIRAAGHSLDVHVSFSVENADVDQLLSALLTPAGLKAIHEGNRVKVLPR